MLSLLAYTHVLIKHEKFNTSTSALCTCVREGVSTHDRPHLQVAFVLVYGVALAIQEGLDMVAGAVTIVRPCNIRCCVSSGDVGTASVSAESMVVQGVC